MEVVHGLEETGLSCWVAPRDLRPGHEFGDEILTGIRASRCLVLVLSAAANNSPMVRREVERAVSLGKPVFPVRIEEVMPLGSLEFFVSATHWIDAWRGHLTDHARRLARELSDDKSIKEIESKLQGRLRWQRLKRRTSISSLLVIAIAALALIISLGGRGSQAVDPIAAEAEAQGFDIDDVSASEFRVGVERTSHSHVSLKVHAQDRVARLAENGLLQFRVGRRAWARLSPSYPMPGFSGLLSDEDLAAKGPVELRFYANFSGTSPAAHGNYTFDIDLQAELDRRDDSRIASSSWLTLVDGGWKADGEFFTLLATKISEVQLGLTTDTQDVRVKVPNPPSPHEPGYESALAAVMGVPSRLDAALAELPPHGRLFGRLLRRDGRTNPVVQFEAPKDRKVIPERGRQQSGFDGSVDSALSFVLSRKFPGVSVSGAELDLSGLSEVGSVIDHVEIRRAKGQPTRDVSVLNEPTSDGRFSVYLTATDRARSTQHYVKIPPHWPTAHIVIRFVDGRSAALEATDSNPPHHRGFLATPTGPNASEAPPCYVSYSSGYGFSLMTWERHYRGTVTYAKLKQPLLGDELTVTFRSAEKGTARRFSYGLTRLDSIEEELSYSIRTIRVDAYVVYSGDAPAVSVDVSRDGRRAVVATADGVTQIIDRTTGNRVTVLKTAPVAMHGSGPGAQLSPDGKRVVVFDAADKTQRGPRKFGTWHLINAESGSKISRLEYPAATASVDTGQPVFSSDGSLLWFKYRPRLRSILKLRARGRRILSPVWRARDGDLRLGLKAPGGCVLAALTGTRVVTLSEDGSTLRVVDLNSKSPKVAYEFTLSTPAYGAEVAPDGTSIAVHSQSEEALHVYRLPEFKEILKVYSKASVLPPYGADGGTVLSTPMLAGRRHEIWDLSTGKSVFRASTNRLELISRSVCWVFDADGRKRRLTRVPSQRPIENVPRAPHDNAVRENPFRDEHHDFMLWSTSGAGFYFIDLLQPRCLLLQVPESLHCSNLVSPVGGRWIAATRSDGAAVIWKTR